MAEVSVVFQPSPPKPPPGEPSTSATIWREEKFRDWPPLEWPPDPVRAPAPAGAVVWQVRLLSAVGLVGVILFFKWLLTPEIRGEAWFFWPVFACMAYRALWWVMEWMNYARPKFEPHIPPRRPWTVDVLTTACPGEPRGMILRTLLAMKAIGYPHTDYLCDEGDDPILREACEALGIRHVTRKLKTDAKAGNINNALTQATGEIAVVLDPDHEPSPYLLDRVLGHFEDPSIGFVQSVQAYRNQSDSLVADGAAKQTYLFYGPVMIGMNAYGTTQAIGANCVFRRAALDSIGGHAAGLSEDMHTTMRLYAQGWRSVYVPEILTRGLVPSTLSAYCKQQLKWACGSIELLLHEYPKLFRGMTWWQRLHYFFAPLYFLRGLIGAVDILVPIACLLIGGIPLRINLVEFLAMYLPVLSIATIIRQRSQYWAVERRERGAHLIGGLLGAGCWWAFLRGVSCAFLRIRLPYIPTPKENEAHDCWPLAAPNLIAAAASVGAVCYGLHRDWTPYSWMMAAFALWNAAQLTWVAALGQQRTLERLRYFFARRDWVALLLVTPLERARSVLQSSLLHFMRERPILASSIAVLAAVGLHVRLNTNTWRPEDPREFKDTGGFYIGARFSEAEKGQFPKEFEATAHQIGAKLGLFPVTLEWGPTATNPFPRDLLRTARLKGAVPLLRWEPRGSTFPQFANHRKLRRDRQVFGAVLDGDFDEYLAIFAREVRDFGDPVLICLAPGMDGSNQPWAGHGGDTGEDFAEAWDYIATVFNDIGATNVGWVWQPASPSAFATHFPSKTNVDWIGVPTLNAGRLGGSDWRTFAELYEPFRRKARPLHLPVLLNEFGTVTAGGDAASWLRTALAGIRDDFPEIRGLILPRAHSWFAVQDSGSTQALAAGFAEARLAPPVSVAPRTTLWAEQSRQTVRSGTIHGSVRHYEMHVDGQPFYVRGVAYNPGHDWRDGFIPLTRRELEEDFDRLKSIGANTIRRYGSNWYDRNILSVAHEKDLKVLFGFWFGQKVDYLTDDRKRKKYWAQVRKTVRDHRDETAIIGWSLGNEVWGLLKHEYAQPYLTEVRHAHIDFVEALAREVHRLDPKRPVFVAHEHSPQLAGTLADFARGAPSIDFTAVNSYYEARISRLNALMTQFDPSRPYLVSEFGPDGYWETNRSQRTTFGAVLEPASPEKVRGYERGWSVHTAPHRGANIGGVAYCWRDRYEATATWFGLTDSDGRLKPSGLALQHLWTGSQAPPGPEVLDLQGPASVVTPGSSIQVRAEVEVPPGSKVTYQWRVGSEYFDFKGSHIVAETDQPRATITLPKKEGIYRIYFAVAGAQSVDEMNIPIKVTRDISAGWLVPAEVALFRLRGFLAGP